MTYQKPSQAHNDDNADTASSLFLNTVTPPPPASLFSFGQGGGVPATKTKHSSVSMKAMVVTCVLLVTLAVIYGGRGGSISNNRGTLEDPPMWNKDLMLVDVQEEDQVQGRRCCPKDTDGCTSFHGGGAGSAGVGDVHCDTRGVPEGIICKPRVGGFCCDDSTSNHYTWWSVNLSSASAPVGCLQNSCFRCVDGSNCCHTQNGSRDSSCPSCECAGNYGSNVPCCGQEGTGTVSPSKQCPQSKPKCVNYVHNEHWGTCNADCAVCNDGSPCCHPPPLGGWNYHCPGCGASF